MKTPRMTFNKVALAFAVGSGVYFWYQFAALAAVESQISTQLQNVGLQSLLTPSDQVTATQSQAPYIAGLAAIATLLLV